MLTGFLFLPCHQPLNYQSATKAETQKGTFDLGLYPISFFFFPSDLLGTQVQSCAAERRLLAKLGTDWIRTGSRILRADFPDSDENLG